MIRTLAFTATTLLISFSAFAADINVASHVANVPFEFENGQGQLTGFEIDLVNLIAKKTGKSIEYTQMPFNSLFAAVQSGRADIAIGSITVTKKRLESVAFTQPYIDASQCLTVATTSGIKALEDLKGKQVAVVTGATGEILASQNQEKYGFSGINRYDGPGDAMLDLSNGRVNGFIYDCANAGYYIKDKPQYVMPTVIPTSEHLGLMTTKGSPLLETLNDAITKLKNEGEIARLYEKWFDVPAPKDSSTVQVLPIPTL